VLLFDSATQEFAKAKELSAQEQKKIAQKDFDKWFIRGSEFWMV
jgi:hypothetical protein